MTPRTQPLSLLHKNTPRGSGGVKPPSLGSAVPPVAPPDPALGPGTIPYLPRGVWLTHDRVRDLPVLQAPERAMQLDPVGKAILTALDGRTLAQIIDGLSAAYAAPRDQIAGDVTAFLQGLVDRRMVFVRLP